MSGLHAERTILVHEVSVSCNIGWLGYPTSLTALIEKLVRRLAQQCILRDINLDSISQISSQLRLLNRPLATVQFSNVDIRHDWFSDLLLNLLVWFALEQD